MKTEQSSDAELDFTPSPQRMLRARDIRFIEEALREVGLFGEVHLVIERGRIRFVRTIRSESLDEPKR